MCFISFDFSSVPLVSIEFFSVANTFVHDYEYSMQLIRSELISNGVTNAYANILFIIFTILFTSQSN